MTLQKLLAAIPIITLLVIPAPLHAQTGGDPDVVIVTEDDNGQTITLIEGNILRLELSANPTTGYDWMPDPANWATTITSDVAVIDVLPGSPAEVAGLVPGDIIRSINGDPEVRGATFNDQLEVLSGSDVTLGILHNLTPQDVTLTADVFPAGDTAFVYVAEVGEGTPAEEAGFLPEDILLAANGTPVTGMEQLIDMVQLNADQAMTITVGRPFDTFDLIVTPTADESGTVRLGLAVQELTPSIIGATVGDFDVRQAVGLVDETSGPTSEELILTLLDLEPEFTPDSEADGAGGTEVIRFRADAPGETTLRLNYAATFESNPEPTDTFEIHIVIGGDSEGSEAPQTLTETDNGTSITLNEGDTLHIQLESNETTGYFWVLDEALDQAVLQQVGEPEYVGENTDAVGAGGMETWTFEAVGSGTTTITLNLERLHDTNPETAATFTVTVTVGGQSSDVSGDADMTLTDADNGQTITLSAGNTLHLELESNPTTGYHWHLEPLNEAILQQVGEPVYTHTSPEGTAGGGGIETWTFQAVGPGITTLSFILYPPGEPSALETYPIYKVTVEVK